MSTISLETLKLYQMYLEREKKNFKHDSSKTWSENLAESTLISLTLDRVNYTIGYYEEVFL